MYRSDYSDVDGWAERARRPGRQAHSPVHAGRPRVRLVPGQRARPALAAARHDPVGGARQRVHAPADAGRAGRADLAGVDGALAAPLGPRRRAARRRAAAWGRLGYPRRALRLHEAAQAVAERHGDVVPATWRRWRRCPASAPTRPGPSRRSATGCAAPCRHERPPGGRAGRARCGRRGAGAGSRRPRRRRRPAAARRRRGRARVGRADGAGRGRLHGPRAAVRGVPGAIGVRVARWRAARRTTGPRRPVQAFAGPTGRSAAG